LIEMLIALAITATLLAAVMVALHASFMAYQTTTELASTHTIGRLVMHRMLALIRTGQEFGPFPNNPQDSIVSSTDIEFLTPWGHLVVLEWIETPDPTHSQANALYVTIDGGTPHVMLEGVIVQLDGAGFQVLPFTLEYELGRKLHRATIDIMLVPDDNMSVAIDGDSQQVLRLVASAMPRITAFAD
jgi:hypothetical protein